MKYGVCIDYKRAQMVKELGFDYIEPMLSVVADYSDEEFEVCKNTLESLGLKAECFNALFFGDIKIIGANVNKSLIKDYLQKAFDRAKILGAETIVFGSGKARSTQDGYTKEECFEALVDICRFIGDIASEYGITIVIEPLCRQETDMINTVAEGIDLVKRVNHQNFKCLADMYHVDCSGETLEAVETAGTLLHHFHARDVVVKGNKTELLNATHLERWVKSLKSIGYNNRISLEFKADHGENLARDVLTVRKLLNAFE